MAVRRRRRTVIAPRMTPRELRLLQQYRRLSPTLKRLVSRIISESVSPANLALVLTLSSCAWV